MAPRLLFPHSLTPASLPPRRAEERSQQPYLAACESVAVHLVWQCENPNNSSNTNPAGKIWLVWRSAQRHKGGVRRTGDSRGAECLSSLIHPTCKTRIDMPSVRERSADPRDCLCPDRVKLVGSDALRRNLEQGQQHKSSIQHARMRQHQCRAVHAGRPVNQQVQVQRARCVWVGALAPGLLFDLLQGRQQSRCA